MDVSQQYLRDYAYKIFKNVPGYTFTKVITLFSKYAGVIMSYYEEFVKEDKKKQVAQTGFYLVADVTQRIKNFTDSVTSRIDAINKNFDAERAKLNEQYRGDVNYLLLETLNLDQAFKLSQLAFIEMDTYTKLANETAPIFGADAADSIYKMIEFVINDAKPLLEAIQNAMDDPNPNIQTIANVYNSELIRMLETSTRKNY